MTEHPFVSVRTGTRPVAPSDVGHRTTEAGRCRFFAAVRPTQDILSAHMVPESNSILLGDNLDLLATFDDGTFQLIYIDPPFNTGSTQTRRTLRTFADQRGDRTGFQGRRYRTEHIVSSSYADTFDDYVGFLKPRLEHARRLLTETGTLYLHLDYREAHYCKILLDDLFGREAFLNEIIWAYDYGARSKRRWPTKHDTILVYVRDPARYYFDADDVDREPYMAPGLVTPEKAARGKLPTDVWWHTIVPTNGREKTGYPTQKPEGIIRRMVVASTRPGDWCLDFFAGSGTLGAVAKDLGRHYVLIDANPEAVRVAKARIGDAGSADLADFRGEDGHPPVQHVGSGSEFTESLF
jgi:site-specific DNA-methyltransferase (adenine-specific)